ncbi:hypothetical protein KY311_00510 [Candidatus Woesearchaeota archaeon]|nr:hypothetical protein [Candidatus Woesearchaeota archaeon]MBW3017027.1 hypothetical protein [Candidatus Woesearchaeota archaeon]
MALDKKDFIEMRKEIEEYDEKREELIRQSRDIIKLSKQIIYAVHRKDFSSAEKDLNEIKSLAEKISSKVQKDPKLDIGSFKQAIQEYVEAAAYYHFEKTKKLPTKKELAVDAEYYLLGLCDLTGELVRNAVNSGINDDTQKVVEIKKFVDELYDELMQFDLRNSELRRKVDGVKWDLKKLDDLVFGLKLRQK